MFVVSFKRVKLERASLWLRQQRFHSVRHNFPTSIISARALLLERCKSCPVLYLDLSSARSKTTDRQDN